MTIVSLDPEEDIIKGKACLSKIFPKRTQLTPPSLILNQLDKIGSDICQIRHFSQMENLIDLNLILRGSRAKCVRVRESPNLFQFSPTHMSSLIKGPDDNTSSFGSFGCPAEHIKSTPAWDYEFYFLAAYSNIQISISIHLILKEG